MLTAMVLQARRTGRVAELLDSVEQTAPIPAVGGLLVLGSGIGLVLVVDAYGILSGFVLIGIGVIVVSGAAESIYFGRQVTAIRGLLQDATRPGEVRLRLTRLLRAAVAVDVLYLLVIWAMVFKPGQ